MTGMPEGTWTPVVRVGERTVVAVRGDAVRQVWVGIGASRFVHGRLCRLLEKRF